MNAGQEWVWRACWVFETQGHVLPSIWAQSKNKRALALPMENATDGDLTRGILMGLMAQAIDAHQVGTIHEAWVREFDTHDDVANLKPGDLETMAEVDPKVRTALISTWGDFLTGEIRSEMASMGLSDHGDVMWDWSESTEPVGPIAAMVRATVSSGGIAADDPLTMLMNVADGLDWRVLLWDE